MLLVIELEENYLIYPIEGLLLFCGRSLRSSNFALHSLYRRSHCLVDLLIIESEATREEFRPNFVSVRIYFWETYLVCRLSVT